LKGICEQQEVLNAPIDGR